MNRLRAYWACAVAMIILVASVGVVEAASGPFLAKAIKDKVEVRAGAGRAFYTAGELKKGEEVKVQELRYGWYRIAPPKGVRSLVGKAYVDKKEGSQIGTVNANGTKIYVAMMGSSNTDSLRAHAILNTGKTVKIVGEVGNMYKIEPPEGTTVYVAPGTLRKVSAAAGVAPSKQPVVTRPFGRPAVSKPVVKKPIVKPVAKPVVGTNANSPKVPAKASTGTKLVPGRVIDPKAPMTGAKSLTLDKKPGGKVSLDNAKAPVVEENKISKELKELQKKMELLLTKPLKDQPLDVMIGAYEKLLKKKGVSDIDKEFIGMKLEALTHNKELLALLATIEEAEKPVEVKVKKPEHVVIEYNAVGQLYASAIYDGKTLPRMYRLRDPSSARTLMYVKPGGKVDGRATLGRLVGIVGVKSFDPSLKLDVIKVEKIDVLEKTVKK